MVSIQRTHARKYVTNVVDVSLLDGTAVLMIICNPPYPLRYSVVYFRNLIQSYILLPI